MVLYLQCMKNTLILTPDPNPEFDHNHDPNLDTNPNLCSDDSKPTADPDLT